MPSATGQCYSILKAILKNTRDLGNHPDYQKQRERLSRILMDWSLTDHNRITSSDEWIESYDELDGGVLIGFWDEDELKAAQTEASRLQQLNGRNP